METLQISLLPEVPTTSSQEASLARTSATPITKDVGWMVRDQGCSLHSCELFASADPVTSFWKTSQRCFQNEVGAIWGQYSGSFPSAGMMRNGKLYQRQAWERPIYASESLLLPTVIANDWKAGNSDRILESRSAHLRDLVTMPDFLDQWWGSWIETSNPLLPTVTPDEDGGSLLRHLKRRKRSTPSSLAVIARGNSRDGKLSPQLCEWMMGFPAGWTELED